jgi:Asp-tRNA(Asn)/Glu-tRNA(Gln) amidotransferase A subunit family amidase
VTTDLAYLSATNALRQFRSKTLSPLELLDAVIARAEEVEPSINAFTDTFFDEAREQAAAATEAYTAGTARPLEGISVAFKDETAILGQRLKMGSVLFEHQMADHTDPIAQRVLDAGGIVHARTATPEFSMAIFTWGFLHGVTRNPWNPEITCGGSSGGAGASLAAGTTTLANGSDIGGSIRIPAAMNGITGLKPPWGRVPEYWPWNRDPYAASGAMGRSVADIVAMLNVVGGPLASDMFSLPRLELPGSFEGVAGMRIALSSDLGYFEPEAEVREALGATAGLLRELGATVDEVRLGWDERVRDVAMTHLDFQAGTLLKAEVPRDRYDELTPYLREYLERPPVSTLEWIESGEHADGMYRELQEAVFLAGYDALVCPTVTTTRIPADWGHPDGEPVDLVSMLAPAMTYPFNVLGVLPVANVPIGMSPGTGVPIGMQIVGPKNRDDVPLRVAAGIEEAAGPFFEHHRPGPEHE